MYIPVTSEARNCIEISVTNYVKEMAFRKGLKGLKIKLERIHEEVENNFNIRGTMTE